MYGHQAVFVYVATVYPTTIISSIVDILYDLQTLISMNGQYGWSEARPNIRSHVPTVVSNPYVIG